MPTLYISDEFSFDMVPDRLLGRLRTKIVSDEDAQKLIETYQRYDNSLTHLFQGYLGRTITEHEGKVLLEIYSHSRKIVSRVNNVDIADALELPFDPVGLTLAEGDSMLYVQVLSGSLRDGAIPLPERLPHSFWLRWILLDFANKE